LLAIDARCARSLITAGAADNAGKLRDWHETAAIISIVPGDYVASRCVARPSAHEGAVDMDLDQADVYDHGDQ
jgi:hypothetical protein